MRTLLGYYLGKDYFRPNNSNFLFLFCFSSIRYVRKDKLLQLVIKRPKIKNRGGSSWSENTCVGEQTSVKKQYKINVFILLHRCAGRLYPPLKKYFKLGGGTSPYVTMNGETKKKHLTILTHLE